MRSAISRVAATLFFAIPGFMSSASVVAAEGGGAAAALSVQFGKPTHMQRLYYRKLYEKKPFHDAILFYYDNGLYKIISPGEEHYGSYVVDGSFSAEKYTVHFIAFPSADWNNTSAYHVLEFDNATHKFTQRAIVPFDGKIPQQHGDFLMSENKVANPLGANWENGKNLAPQLEGRE